MELKFESLTLLLILGRYYVLVPIYRTLHRAKGEKEPHEPLSHIQSSAPSHNNQQSSPVQFRPVQPLLSDLILTKPSHKTLRNALNSSFVRHIYTSSSSVDRSMRNPTYPGRTELIPPPPPAFVCHTPGISIKAMACKTNKQQ